MFRSLDPGKYAEFVDLDVEYLSPDGTLRENSDLRKLNVAFLNATRQAGIEPSPGPLLARWMEDTGFTDIVASRRFLPLGTWPADKTLVSMTPLTATMRLTKKKERSGGLELNDYSQ